MFAYVSTESGRAEIFVRSVGSRSGDMMAAEVTLGGMFTARPPRRLFSASGMLADPFHHTYSVSRDGRFLMISQMSGSDLVMVFNWADELGERR